jgi:hypothetical protein
MKLTQDKIKFYLLDFIQYLFIYFGLSVIGLKFVYTIEQFVLDDIETDLTRPRNLFYTFIVMFEVIFMLGLNIIIYIIIVIIGKSIPSIAAKFYPYVTENPLVYFIQDFIILFILVIGDVRLEYYLEKMRN